MLGNKLGLSRKLGKKSSFPRMLGNKRRHTRGKLQFLNTHFPTSVPVPEAKRLKNCEKSGKLGE